MFHVTVWTDRYTTDDMFPTTEVIVERDLKYESSTCKVLELARAHAEAIRSNAREFNHNKNVEFDYLYCEISCDEYRQTTRFNLL